MMLEPIDPELLERLEELPAIRLERVEPIRQAIREGRYDADSKLQVALDRLLEEI